jgi:capsid assembly protease
MNRSRSRRLMAAVHNTPWAIMPEKLAEIRELIELRSQGIRLTDEQIAARVAVSRVPSQISASNKIAVLNLFGTISHRMNFMSEFSGGTSIEMFGKAFDAAVNEPEISSILIIADTPGGTVPGVMELSDRIYAARGKKRIVTFVDPMMASAGLWIGTSAGEVIATPSAQHIGSLGVMYIHQDETKALEKAGIQETVITSNEFKGELHGALTESARKHLESRVAAMHQQFVASMARNRGVSAAKVENDFGRGRTMTATEALAVGLIDRIATLETVLSELGATGLSAGPSGVPLTAGSTGKERTMHPKVLTCLIRAGLIEAGCSEDQYRAGIDKFFAVRNTPKPDGNDEFLAGVMSVMGAAPPVAAAVAVQPLQAVATFGAGDQVSTDTIVASLRIATNIPADAKLALQAELISAATAGKLTTSQMLDRINEAAAAATPKPGATTIASGAAQVDKFQTQARDAILLRAWGGNTPEQIYDWRKKEHVAYKPQGGNDYGLQSLPRLGQRVLMAAGIPAEQVLSLSTVDVAMLLMGGDASQHGIYLASDGPAYNVSGMFSKILLDASNVMLRRSYDEQRATFTDWMRNGPSVPDFKPVHKVIAGELGDPRAVPENGEFEETTMLDAKEMYRLTVWGEVISYTWQMIVNDQLGAFAEFDMKLGAAMRRKQNRLAYGVLKDNPTMADTGALFNLNAVTTAGGHANLSTGSITNYGDAFNTLSTAMKKQRGLSSDSAMLGIGPSYIIYPPDLNKKIRGELGAMADPSSSNAGTINIYRGAFQPVEESELSAEAGGSATAFYMAARAAEIDTIEYAYLQGLETPRIEMATAFDRLAIRKRIYHAFAVAPIDFRGLQKHAGA